MDYKTIKEVYKIQDNIIGHLMRIRALLTILEDRNIEEYPNNYLFKFIRKIEKSAAHRVCECTKILSDTLHKKS